MVESPPLNRAPLVPFWRPCHDLGRAPDTYGRRRCCGLRGRAARRIAGYLAFYRQVYRCEGCGQSLVPDALVLTCRCCNEQEASAGLTLRLGPGPPVEFHRQPPADRVKKWVQHASPLPARYAACSGWPSSSLPCHIQPSILKLDLLYDQQLPAWTCVMGNHRV
jgi:hypothetical protein